MLKRSTLGISCGLMIIWMMIFIGTIFDKAWNQIIERNRYEIIPLTYSGPFCINGCTCKREVVRCSHLNLTSLPEFIDLGPFTTAFDVRYNLIRDITPTNFHLMTKVKVMQLNQNKISRITSFTFTNMGNLKYLYLHKNGLTDIESQAFHGLGNLTHLYLNHNKIRDIRQFTFTPLISLKELFLYDNLIKRIDGQELRFSANLYLLKGKENPIICDCGVIWLLDKLKRGLISSDIVCQEPPYLKNIHVLTLITDNFRMARFDGCTDQENYKHQSDSPPKFTLEPMDKAGKIININTSPSPNIVLECEAFGDPIPHIIWLKNGEIFYKTWPINFRKLRGKKSIMNQNFYQLSNDNRTLNIYQSADLLTKKHYQKITVPLSPSYLTEQENVKEYYECLAYNRVRQIRSNPVYPRRNDIQWQNDQDTPQLNTDKIVKCGPGDSESYLANGSTPYEFQWYKENELLGMLNYYDDLLNNNQDQGVANKNSHKFVIVRRNVQELEMPSKIPARLLLPYLLVKNFDSKDTGIYSCLVGSVNKLYGERHLWKFETYLTTDNNVPEFDSVINDSVNSLSYIKNDTSTTPLSIKLYVILGSPLTLDCMVKSHSLRDDLNFSILQTVIWTKNGIDLPVLPHLQQQEHHNSLSLLNNTRRHGSAMLNNFSLYISSVEASDTGKYVCQIYGKRNNRSEIYTSKPIEVLIKSNGTDNKANNIYYNELIEHPAHHPTTEREINKNYDLSDAINQVIRSISNHGIPIDFNDEIKNKHSMKLSSNKAVELAGTFELFSRIYQNIEDYVEMSGDTVIFNATKRKLDLDILSSPKILSHTHIQLMANMSDCKPIKTQKFLENNELNVIINVAAGSTNSRQLPLSEANYIGRMSEVLRNLTYDNSNVNLQRMICLSSRALPFHTKYRTIDGTCNNLYQPFNGASNMPFKRIMASSPTYENGINNPFGWKIRSHNLNFSIESPYEIFTGLMMTNYGLSDADISSYKSVKLLPNPRLVSSKIAASSEITTSSKGYSMMLMQWGQFLDHDLDFTLPALSYESFVDVTPCGDYCLNNQACFPIPPPRQDSRIDKSKCIEFVRSSAACGTGLSSFLTSTNESMLIRREQVNTLTSYLDASNVYGSNYHIQFKLMELDRNGRVPTGKLKVGITSKYAFADSKNKNFLPFDTESIMDCKIGQGILANNRYSCFLAGDHRANEQLGLTAMHTLWMRHHNNLVDALHVLNSHWDGFKLYEEARKIIGAQMQLITYRDWLPLIIGNEGVNEMGYSTLMGDYNYEPTIDASILNVFATVALRFGHGLVSPIMHRLNSTFGGLLTTPLSHYINTTAQLDTFDPLKLHEAFFAPGKLIEQGGIDPLLRGLMAIPGKAIDKSKLITQELTEKLFQSHHVPAFDLIAINLQRGRDHGIPSYIKLKNYCYTGSESPINDDFRETNVFRKLLNFYKVNNDNLTSVREKRINLFNRILNKDFTKNAVENVFSRKIITKFSDLYFSPYDIDPWIGSMLEESPKTQSQNLLGPTLTCLLTQQFKRLMKGDRFWYQNPWVFTPNQLAAIENTSLASIICKNGDYFTHVVKNVFMSPKSIVDFVSCYHRDKITTLDLSAWKDSE